MSDQFKPTDEEIEYLKQRRQAADAETAGRQRFTRLLDTPPGKWTREDVAFMQSDPIARKIFREAGVEI
jgi:hypothetical protein